MAKEQIDLQADDPAVQRAKFHTSPTLTEVGFIPNDKHGCKIYASKDVSKPVRLVGIHSSSYGCHKEPAVVKVVVHKKKE